MNLGARNQNFHVLNEEEVEIETNTSMLVKNTAVFNQKEIFNIKWNSNFEIWNSKLSLHWHASWEHGRVGHLVSSNFTEIWRPCTRLCVWGCLPSRPKWGHTAIHTGCTCPCGFLARVFSKFWETPRHSHAHVSDRVFYSKIHKSFSHTPKLHKSWKCNSKHTWCWKLTPCILYDMKIKQQEWQIDKHTTHASYWKLEQETQWTKIRIWVVSSLMYLVAQRGSLRWKASLPSPWRSLPR